MAQIRIKRSTGSSAPNSSALANAELAFTESDETLYYGKGTSGSTAASVVKVGGKGAFVDLTNAQTVAGNKTFSNDVTVTGNLTVNGTTTTVSTTNTKISDNLLELNSGAGSNANDAGILIERGSTGDNAFIGWDESADKFLLGTTTATNDATGNLTVTTGTLTANLDGNANTASQWATARSFTTTGDVQIASTNWDGSGNFTAAATIQAGAVEMSMIDATGTAGSGTFLRGDGAWTSISGTDTTYSISCVDGDAATEEKIRLTAGGDGSGTDDIVLAASTGLSIARSGDKITFTNTVTNTDTNTTYSVSCVDGDTSTEEKIRLTAGGDGSGTDDVVIAAGTGLSIARDGDKITLTNTVTDTNTTYTAGTGLNLSGTEFAVTTSPKVTVTDNESTNENNLIAFVAGAATSTGSQDLEMDGDFHYNPSTGLLTVGQIDGGTF